MLGLILYGPPAAGKDTVTAALHSLDFRYELYKRLKVGPGRTDGYRSASAADIEALRSRGDLVWENSRYGARYAIDRSYLLDLLLYERIPVVHVGQPPAVLAIQEAISDAHWVVAHLWCPRRIAVQRLNARGTGDLVERLEAWDHTSPIEHADRVIDTSSVDPQRAARTIAALVGEWSQGGRVSTESAETTLPAVTGPC